MTDPRIQICLKCPRETCSGGDGVCNYTKTFGKQKPPMVRQHRCGFKQKDNGIEFQEIAKAIHRAAEKMGIKNGNFGRA